MRAGHDEGRLWFPARVVAVGCPLLFVVCDRGAKSSRLQVFSQVGSFQHLIAIRYMERLSGLCATPNGALLESITNHSASLLAALGLATGLIVAVDGVSPSVFLIHPADGRILRWFDCSDVMREPSDVAAVDDTVYVCDFKACTQPSCSYVVEERGNAAIGTSVASLSRAAAHR